MKQYRIGPRWAGATNTDNGRNQTLCRQTLASISDKALKEGRDPTEVMYAEPLVS